MALHHRAALCLEIEFARNSAAPSSLSTSLPPLLSLPLPSTSPRLSITAAVPLFLVSYTECREVSILYYGGGEESPSIAQLCAKLPVYLEENFKGHTRRQKTLRVCLMLSHGREKLDWGHSFTEKI